MRVPPDHFAANTVSDVVEIEFTGLRGHLGMKNDLKKQVSQLVTQGGHVFSRDRIRDLIGLLDRIGGNTREVLLAVPGAAAIRISQTGHNLK